MKTRNRLRERKAYQLTYRICFDLEIGMFNSMTIVLLFELSAFASCLNPYYLVLALWR